MIERVGAYFYFFPTYKQGKKILWNGMDRDGFKFMSHIPEELRKRTDNTEMLIELKNGSIFQIIGTDNIDSIVGTNPVGCVFSEYSLQDPIAWDYIRPILAENGGWAIFNFTPRGENHGYDLLKAAENDPKWFTEVLTVKDTKAISLEVLEQERKEILQKNGDDSMFQQEYFCSFNASVQGSYYGHIMRQLEESNHVTNGLFDPILPVSTWWDLGMDDSMTILFTQQFGKEIRFIDYFEASGEGLSFYVKKLSEKPYVYERHYFPHDGEVREIGTGKSRKEVAISLGLKNLEIVKKPESKEDGIEAVRSILPRVYIDKTNCERLISALKNYSKEWDERNKIFKSYPNHDWSSHAADSVQTFALGHKDPVGVIAPPKITYDRFGRPTIN